MDEGLRALYDVAKEIRKRAYVPYSNFAVGAAILADDGQIHAGCNVENAAYPQGCCAEASAISAMVGNGGRKIRSIVVVGAGVDPVTPCGGCRQRIREFANSETIIVCASVDGACACYTINDILPDGFGPEHLEVAE